MVYARMHAEINGDEQALLVHGIVAIAGAVGYLASGTSTGPSLHHRAVASRYIQKPCALPCACTFPLVLFAVQEGRAFGAGSNQR